MMLLMTIAQTSQPAGGAHKSGTAVAVKLNLVEKRTERYCNRKGDRVQQKLRRQSDRLCVAPGLAAVYPCVAI